MRFCLAAAAAAVVVAVLVPLAQARTHRPKAQTVTVTMTEYKFTFGGKVHAGKVTFDLVDHGKLAHDLQIAGKTSAIVQPGKTGKLVVTLKKGKYPYKCTVPGHAALGMKGTLRVA
jgi:uncharacterized cupredoxin-like copper-binding protein